MFHFFCNINDNINIILRSKMKINTKLKEKFCQSKKCLYFCTVKS